MIKINDIIDKKYQVLKKIGKGGFGKVFRVKNLENNVEEALKICLNTNNLGDFKDEVSILQSLKHENVIKVLFTNLDYATPYFVMPVAEKTLSKEIKKLKNDTKKALKVFLEICLGVDYLHNNKVIHRDLTPENIFILNGERVVISDFGLSREQGTIEANYKQAKIGFIPPECMDISLNTQPQFDIFQLGMILYRILGGKGVHPKMESLDNYQLQCIVEKSIESELSERYKSVCDIIDELKIYIEKHF